MAYQGPEAVICCGPGNLTLLTRPDTLAVGIHRDAAGRPDTVTFDRDRPLVMAHSIMEMAHYIWPTI